MLRTKPQTHNKSPQINAKHAQTNAPRNPTNPKPKRTKTKSHPPQNGRRTKKGGPVPLKSARRLLKVPGAFVPHLCSSGFYQRPGLPRCDNLGSKSNPFCKRWNETRFWRCFFETKEYNNLGRCFNATQE